ncbi:helix-turn-helix domain-containing protein [Picosynechococcus sp. PCC 8807]|uniref:helix-turn-helix domain-containing protein n=1 Tax=Picosynechococcus sp. PCC 8807 TaxID=195248 RepID=UPI000810886D|nr:helix-turn-helix domain-containing protein [Picosynechococcus sp. PCC 8807]ANV90883.1 hypothetical protein AWQ24_09695 [Picosynechococcus sp. PCC 8807]
MPNSPNSPWFPTSAMAQALGINPKTLIRNRKRFKEGHHYYNANPFGDRPSYRWHHKRIFKTLKVNP